MTGEIIVRHAAKADLEILVGFNLAMARETEARALNPAVLQSGVAAVLQDEALGFYLIAEVAGQPVGQLMVTTEWSDWRNAHFWWIQSVYVHRDFRRRGVYRSLHNYVCRLAWEAGNVCGLRLYVERTNRRAQQVYAALDMSLSHYDMYELEY